MALPPHLADLEKRLASRFAEVVAEYRRAAEARLRQESERWLGALAEVPGPGGWLVEDDFAELDVAPKDAAKRATLEQLTASLRAIDLAQGQAEALDALLDAGHAWAGRVALVLARDRGLTVWGDRGFGGDPLAGRELDWDTTLRERLLASRGCLRLDAESATEVLARFEVEAAGGALVVPLVLRDRIAALLWADGESPSPELAALQILVHATGQRLELQALSDRAFSPTLWEGAEAPGEPLPLWSVLVPATPDEREDEPEEASIEAPAAPEIAAPERDLEAAAEESGAELWQAEPAVEEEEEAVAALPVAEAPECDTEEPEAVAFTELAESASETGEVAPPEPELPPIEPERMPAFELESVEAPQEPEHDEAAQWEPEPEPVAEAAPAPDGAAPAVEPPATPEPDLLGTVRMQVPVIEPPAPSAGETTAPLPIVTPSSLLPVETHEIAAPKLVPPPVPDDAAEDATQLSMRRPPIPEPAASAAPPPAPEPPTWSASPIAPPPAPVEDPMDRTASRMSRSTEVAPPPDVSGPGLAFLGGRAKSSSADPAHEEAKRLARLLISEIRLYNEEQVLEGRRHRDLYHRLKEDIDRSRQIFDERVDLSVRSEVDYFQQELIRSLAGGDARALGI